MTTSISGLAAVAGVFALTCVGAAASVPNPNPGGGLVTATVSISPPIKSVTVTITGGAASLTYTNCTGGNSTASALGFPNAICITNPYTVANTGNTPEQIDLQGSPAAPSSGGTAVWNLCGAAPACTGTPSNVPGKDEFLESTHPTSGAGGTSSTVAATPFCDFAFEPATTCGPGDTAANGQTATEYLQILGPKASTDGSPTFSMSVTWTAI